MGRSKNQHLVNELVADPAAVHNFELVDQRLRQLEAMTARDFSKPCTAFTAPVTTFADVPNLVCGVKTKGEPVFVGLQFSPSDLTTFSLVNATNAGTNGAKGSVQILRNNVVIATIPLQVLSAGATAVSYLLSPSNISFRDPVASGIWRYKVQANVADANTVFTWLGVQLVVHEI